MDFSSDTSAPAHPAVLQAIAGVNHGYAPSYGADSSTETLTALLANKFGTEDFDVWLTASGTAANALALAAICPPTASILCHEEAHIERDERGAPEFFSGGAKLALLPGQNGQIDREQLRRALGAIDRSFVHETPPTVLSLTNLTECGTAYSTDRIGEYAGLAHENGLTVHLDGARLANALVSQRATLADMTWRAGVDVLTLGLTKTGAMGCELIVLFGAQRSRFGDLRARAKRAGHMPPKLRYLAAQGIALFQDDLWLDLAAQANCFAQQLSETLCAAGGATLAYPVDGNEVFVHLPKIVVGRLRDAGAKFYPWPGGSHRFVCSWATMEDDIGSVRAVLSS